MQSATSAGTLFHLILPEIVESITAGKYGKDRAGDSSRRMGANEKELLLFSA